LDGCARVKNAPQYFLDVIDRRQSGVRLAPFHVEHLDYRIQDRKAFDNGLEGRHNGPKAVRELRQAFG